MAAHEFVLRSEEDLIRRIVDEVLDANGFDARWVDEWNAVVERGSRARSVLLGGFSPHVRADLAVRSLDAEPADAGTFVSERTVVRLDNRSVGMLGGVMGAQKSRSGWNELRAALGEGFGRHDLLIEERDPGPSRLA